VRLEDIGLIGNCQFSALVAKTGEIVWCCLPRFDAEPLFGALLDEEGGGSFRVAPAGGGLGTQRYLPNTNVLETTFTTDAGSFRVIDFAPRFFANDRAFRPTMLVRIIEPIEGSPRVRVACDPLLGWSKRRPARTMGSNHIDFEGYAARVRLTTDIPLAYVGGEAFSLTHRRHLIFTWGEPAVEDLASMSDRLLGQTTRYWNRWVKHCNVPARFQSEVIRSALALKLHQYEDTGAIIAATTTSVVEAPGSGRNWDYRYCWLRDAYYSLAAFRLLGQFEERERFATFLLNVAENHPNLDLRPLYRIDGKDDLDEHILREWPGFRGEGPVRIGNEAVTHQQHDVFGEMVLALAPVFLDDRFREDQTDHTLNLLERLTQKAISVCGTPDAGIWEFRNGWKTQTFSSLMCWAAADRMAMIASRHRPGVASQYRTDADRIRREMIDRAYRADMGSFVATYDGAELDASLLQIVTLRLLSPSDPRMHGTIDSVIRHLAKDGWLLRYASDDGFGSPKVAFILCSFWLVEALAIAGRRAEASTVFERAMSALSPLGLLSEDYETATLRMWGNFPQAYSHVGLIHAAFAASPSWPEEL
jgi:GH15 family glucan-1,4-alpha-glucosidase